VFAATILLIVHGEWRGTGMFDFKIACEKMWWQLCGVPYKQHICGKDQQSHSLSA